MFLVMCEWNNGRVHPLCVMHSTSQFASWKSRRIASKRRFECVESNTRTLLRISYGEAWVQYTLEYVPKEQES